MKVLLTGAAGNVGLVTLKKLLDNKYDVIALELYTKKNKKKLKKYENKAKIVYGSINDEDLITSLVNKVDAIIHLAAIIPPLADLKPKLAKQVNFFGTLNIVNAIKGLENKPFLIFSSSISVYGDRVDNCYINVSDKLKPSEGDYYAVTKIEAEELIKTSNIPYTIFRFTAIMGYPKIDPLMFHMPLDTKIEIASNVDAATALVNALKHKTELKGNIYNLSGGEKCRTTYREFLNNMLKIYGLNPKHLKETSFATQNFHCAYYEDNNKLNDILNFQNDTLATYYKRVRKEINPLIKILSRIFSRSILYFLQKKSEPMLAVKNKEINLINRFFKK
jgi:nucleoside-diphosphate-sugar epimerase